MYITPVFRKIKREIGKCVKKTGFYVRQRLSGGIRGEYGERGPEKS